MKENLLHLPKEKANFSKITGGNGEGGGLFCGEFQSVLSKLMFTDSAVAME